VSITEYKLTSSPDFAQRTPGKQKWLSSIFILFNKAH